MTTSQESPYRILQTLGKAVKKTWNALSTSPQKQIVIVNNSVKKSRFEIKKGEESNVNDDDQSKEFMAKFLYLTRCRVYCFRNA